MQKVGNAPAEASVEQVGDCSVGDDLGLSSSVSVYEWRGMPRRCTIVKVLYTRLDLALSFPRLQYAMIRDTIHVYIARLIWAVS